MKGPTSSAGFWLLSIRGDFQRLQEDTGIPVEMSRAWTLGLLAGRAMCLKVKPASGWLLSPPEVAQVLWVCVGGCMARPPDPASVCPHRKPDTELVSLGFLASYGLLGAVLKAYFH